MIKLTGMVVAGENYQDRKESTFVGLYKSTVKDQIHPYVRPQESGNKTDVRWFTLTSSNGTGLRFSSQSTLNFTARAFLDSDLDDGSAKTIALRIIKTKTIYSAEYRFTTNGLRMYR